MKEELEVTKQRSILVPFLVGGLVGAGVAFLLAPKSGKDLRKDIKDIAEDTRNRVTHTIEKGKDLYVEGSAAVKSAIDAGKMAYTEEMEKHRKVA